MYRVVDALTSIAERRGVRFIYNNPVEKIMIEGRRATGVALADGHRIQADVVVANADLCYVYRRLLPDAAVSQPVERKKHGCSALMFYWGLDRRYPQLEPHNLFIAGDYCQSFDPIFQDLTLPADPSFYVHAPVRIDPSLAPAGHDTLVVAVPVGHINGAAPQDWKAIQARARKIVLSRLAQIGASDLEEHIKFEVSFTPPDWRARYNLTKGSCHGLSHNLLQMAYLRPPNRHRRYRNLYFVGASTHPGTGMPTVLVSARLTTARILQEVGVPQAASVFRQQQRRSDILV
jgi:phytoene desaturase